MAAVPKRIDVARPARSFYIGERLRGLGAPLGPLTTRVVQLSPNVVPYEPRDENERSLVVLSAVNSP